MKYSIVDNLTTFFSMHDCYTSYNCLCDLVIMANTKESHGLHMIKYIICQQMKDRMGLPTHSITKTYGFHCHSITLQPHKDFFRYYPSQENSQTGEQDMGILPHRMAFCPGDRLAVTNTQ